MKPTSIIVIGGDNDLRRLVEEAAQLAFTSVAVTTANSLKDTHNQPNGTPVNLVVWADPGPDETAETVPSLPTAGSRPWPVVVLGMKVEGLEAEMVPSGEWEKHLLARVFRSAIEQYQLNRQLLRSQGDLLTIGRRINHDLRTPLGCIFTAAETLQEILLSGTPSEVPLSQAILDSTDDLLKLIKRVSFLAQASAQPLPKERVAMRIPLDSAIQGLEWQALKQKVMIAQPADWPEVAGVESWLQVIWWNLIGNALRHGGPSTHIETGWDQRAGEHRFWVTDHGPGVPTEQRQSLFMPFHRLYELDAGRGFGLAIVQRLSELQGGHCGYEPRPDGGSRFYFTLPEIG